LKHIETTKKNDKIKENKSMRDIKGETGRIVSNLGMKK
jgi:hypothetical protein